MLISVWGHMHVSHVVKTHKTLDTIKRTGSFSNTCYWNLRINTQAGSWFPFSLKSQMYRDDWWVEHMQSNCLSRASSHTSTKLVSHVPLLYFASGLLSAAHSPAGIYSKKVPRTCSHFGSLQSPQQLGSKPKSLGLNWDQFANGSPVAICFPDQISLRNVGIFFCP